MNYHNITKDDMLNGSGLRVVLWLSGCNHGCQGCQNPQTWDCNSGIEFDLAAKEEIFNELSKDHISGITFSGGDPLHRNNIDDVLYLCKDIKEKFPTKNIWIYTGYTWEELYKVQYCKERRMAQNLKERNEQYRQLILNYCNVLVDGEFKQELADVKYPWAGSTNQRVIDVQESLKQGEVILWHSS